MINKPLLRRIQKKNPEYSLDQIDAVLSKTWEIINKKTSNCQVLDLTIPKLGRIHTHGNTKNKAKIHIFKVIVKANRERYKYDDKQLLF